MKTDTPLLNGNVLHIETRERASANATYFIHADRELGNSGTNRAVVKRDIPAETSAGEMDTGNFAQLNASILDDTGNVVIHPHLAVRAVAASRLDSALGMHVIADEQFGRMLLPGRGESPEDVSVSALVDGVQLLQLGGDGEYARLKLNYKDQKIQRGLSDLQVAHFLSGQTDGHAGNIFVTRDGGIVGIDNDLGFGTVNYGEGMLVADALDRCVFSLPPLIHVETAQKVEGMTENQLRAVLGAVVSPGGERLDPAEIDASAERLRQAKQQILQARFEGRVVQKFDSSTFKKSLDLDRFARVTNLGYGFGNYLGREYNNQCNAVSGGMTLITDLSPLKENPVRQPIQESNQVALTAELKGMKSELQAKLLLLAECEKKLDKAVRKLKPHASEQVQLYRDGALALRKISKSRSFGEAMKLTTTDPVAMGKLPAAEFKAKVKELVGDNNNFATMQTLQANYQDALQETVSSNPPLSKLRTQHLDLCKSVACLRAEIVQKIEAEMVDSLKKISPAENVVNPSVRDAIDKYPPPNPTPPLPAEHSLHPGPGSVNDGGNVGSRVNGPVKGHPNRMAGVPQFNLRRGGEQSNADPARRKIPPPPPSREGRGPLPSNKSPTIGDGVRSQAPKKKESIAKKTPPPRPPRKF